MGNCQTFDNNTGLDFCSDKPNYEFDQLAWNPNLAMQNSQNEQQTHSNYHKDTIKMKEYINAHLSHVIEDEEEQWLPQTPSLIKRIPSISINTHIVTYVFLDQDGKSRSFERTINKKIKHLKDIPEQYLKDKMVPRKEKESKQFYDFDFDYILLRPVFYCVSPFYPNSFIALCECYDHQEYFKEYNYRSQVEEVFHIVREQGVCFGIEQEFYFLFENSPSQGHYASVDSVNRGRELMEKVVEAFRVARIQLWGYNLENGLHQFEYQLGILKDLQGIDQCVVARYILERVAEGEGVGVSFEPFRKVGQSFSGCHINVSTKYTKGFEGIKKISENYVPKLQKFHFKLLQVYGTGNEERLSGNFETSKYNKFSHGFQNRAVSVRIPLITVKEGKGYFEDRRPSSNIDYYKSIASLIDVVCANGNLVDDLIKQQVNSKHK